MAQVTKRENALDLSGFVDKQVRVKLQGGREVSGVLKGYDQVRRTEGKRGIPAEGAGTGPRGRGPRGNPNFPARFYVCRCSIWSWTRVPNT